MCKYVVTYNNSTGFREWASSPQPTPEAAWSAAGLIPGEEFFPGSDPRLEHIEEPPAEKK